MIQIEDEVLVNESELQSWLNHFGLLQIVETN